MSHEEFHPLPVCYQRISMTLCRLECREEAGRLYRIDPTFAHPASPRWWLLVVVLFHCFVFILFFRLCHMVYGILGPSLGVKHTPPALKAHNLNHGTTREVSRWWFLFPPPEDLPDPEIEPGLLHCRQILYCLSLECFPICLKQISVVK